MLPRPEHPNPQFMRKQFTSLNGKWLFSAPVLGPQPREILVPFCPESKLSGIGYTDFIGECEYRRTFSAEVPREGERVFLHFGAVDYEATVFVNGEKAGTHRGGYTPFSLDITSLIKSGDNELRVKATHNVSANLPSGKQSKQRDSFGCFYTRVTGIWQSVWLERTPADYIKKVCFFPDAQNGSVDIRLCVEGCGKAEIDILYEGEPAGHAEGEVCARRTFSVPLKVSRLWEPGNGRLYDVVLRYGGDEVKSYFGLRDVRFEGMKFLLNGKSVFQRFVLDQGYYPEGLYTAPDESSMIRDIELAMRLGFNGARLHQKIFEPRFLYHCDRLGFMVWGEFPGWGVEYDDLRALGPVVGEWTEAVERDFNHPSIVTWCPLNETWENLDDPRKVRDVRFVDAMYAITKVLDPTRPCVDVSGGFHGHKTDLYDFHDYLDPVTLEKHLEALERKDELIMDKVYAPDFAGEAHLRYPSGTPTCASEYGGMSYSETNSGGWGYRTCSGEEEFVDNYIRLTSRLLDCGKLSGFCYTQLYDVEQEQNGLLRYDRRFKFSQEAMDRIADCNLRRAAIEK